MNLLHPEVEITPGRRGKQGYQERDKMAGTAVLRLVNETTQENAFTVRLRCDNPFWQEGWYTVQSGATPTNAAIPASSQADIAFHNKRSVKVFVPPKGTRDILIRFDVPKRPESRAGRYDYFIEVETQVTRTQEGAARRKDRLTTIPAVANVHPFYEWSLDLTPEQQRVTRRRRAGEFEVVVTNEGNDWLYCDLQLPRPKDLLLECPTLRLAVPPPEPGEMLPSVGIQEGNPGTQRVVPLRATTRLKTFRGELTPQPLTVSAVRVDAPSLPPPSEDGYLSLGSVVASATNPPEVKPAPIDRALVYAPPMPAKLVDFFSRGVGGFRAWIAPLLALMVMASLAYVVIQRTYLSPQMKKGYTFGTTNLAAGGKPLYITGKLIVGSHYTLTDKATSSVLDEGEVKPDIRDKAHPSLGKGVINIPAAVKDVRTILAVERLSRVPFLSSLIPPDKQEVDIGNPQPPQKPEVITMAQGAVKPGGTFRVGIKGFGKGGTVLLNEGGVPAKWSPDQVTINVPSDAKPGEKFIVKLQPLDSAEEKAAGQITVAAPVVLGKIASTDTGKHGSKPGTGGPAGTGSGGNEPSGANKKTKLGLNMAAAGTNKKPADGTGSLRTTAYNGFQAGRTQAGGSQTDTVYNPPPPQFTAEDFLLRNQYDLAISAVASQDTAYAHAIKAIAYAKQNKLPQANSEAASADGGAQTPTDKALALVAKGWIARQQKQFQPARDSFSAAVAADPSSLLARVAQAEGEKRIEDRIKQVNAIQSSQSSLTPAQKADIKFQANDLKKQALQ